MPLVIKKKMQGNHKYVIHNSYFREGGRDREGGRELL